jgi:CheY-like chemotaxis protein
MKRRLLVVDDNPTNLKLMAKILQLAGYSVLTVPSAERAAELLQTEVVDLILMDVGLPGMDGLSMTRLLKNDTRTAHIPVIAVTSFAMKSDEDEALASGCDGFITKPVDTRRLPEQIASFLSAT